MSPYSFKNSFHFVAYRANVHLEKYTWILGTFEMNELLRVLGSLFDGKLNNFVNEKTRYPFVSKDQILIRGVNKKIAERAIERDEALPR